MRRVEVVWLDAVCSEAILPEKKIKEASPLPRRNVGYLVEDNEEYITVSFGVLEGFSGGEDGFEYSMTIPKCMVLRVEEL